jgi:hypothetical protein
MRMRVWYLDCHEAGLCCYLVIHIGNLLHLLRLFYFHLWPIYWLSLVLESILKALVLRMYTDECPMVGSSERENALPNTQVQRHCSCLLQNLAALTAVVIGAACWVSLLVLFIDCEDRGDMFLRNFRTTTRHCNPKDSALLDSFVCARFESTHVHQISWLRFLTITLCPSQRTPGSLPFKSFPIPHPLSYNWTRCRSIG